MVGFTFGWEPLDRFGVKWAPQYVTIPPIKPYEDYDGPVYWDFYYFNLNFGRNCIAMTAKCENKEAAMRFIDQFYSPEGGLQVLFGSLGECIRKNDDGSYTILPPADPSMDPGTWKWTSALADAGPMYAADTIEVELGEDMKALVDTMRYTSLISTRYPPIQFGLAPLSNTRQKRLASLLTSGSA